MFGTIPGSPIVYWVSNQVRDIFSKFPPLNSKAKSVKGLDTCDNERFIRYWYEVDVHGHIIKKHK